MKDRTNVMTGTSRWKLENGRIVVVGADAALSFPTALEVAGAEFKGRLTFGKVKVARPPSDDIEGVEFHRFPLSVRVHVEPPRNGRGVRAT